MTRQGLLALVAVTAAGGLLRLLPLLGADVPVNDGGLFLTMARDIRADGFALPLTTTYNDMAIPFAYPPGGLYLTALLLSVGIGADDALRWLPFVASVATIPVVYLIGREIFGTWRMATATAGFVAVSTGSYEWLVQGGGVTRAPGFLLALLGILLAIRAYRARGLATSVASGIAVGVTGLFHPQAAVFAALSVALLWPFMAADRWVGLRRLVLIGGTSIAVVLPWLLVVIPRYGWEPFLSAAGTGGTPIVGVMSVIASRTSGGHFGILGVLTTLGLAVSFLRGYRLLAIWMLAIAIVDSRAAQPYISVPAALGIAFLLRDVSRVLEPTFRRRPPSAGIAWTGRGIAITVAAVLFLATFADSALGQRDLGTPLRAVSPGEREAMAWVASNTPADATFVVLSGRYWAADAVSEWFPVRADRHSAATVQGYEWLGDERFQRQQQRAVDLAPCVATGDQACIERWFADAGDVDYLFLTRSPDALVAGLECCFELAEQIGKLMPAEVVYDNDSALVVRLGTRP
ncbi:MAG: glycosyltransferase family 39 protein [Candidatus Limnocylindria bacterium]